MKNLKKALIYILCVLILIGATAVTTLAYLTDSDSATNTFAVGKVGISMDEANVKPDGTYFSDENDRVKGNTYHLIPGKTYIKDPTIHVDEDSEDCYVYVKIDNALKFFNIEAETEENGYKSIEDQILANGWKPLEDENGKVIPGLYWREYTKDEDASDMDMPVFSKFMIAADANTKEGWEDFSEIINGGASSGGSDEEGGVPAVPMTTGSDPANSLSGGGNNGTTEQFKPEGGSDETDIPHKAIININGFAVQKAGFDSALDAWIAADFDLEDSGTTLPGEGGDEDEEDPDQPGDNGVIDTPEELIAALGKEDIEKIELAGEIVITKDTTTTLDLKGKTISSGKISLKTDGYPLTISGGTIGSEIVNDHCDLVIQSGTFNGKIKNNSHMMTIQGGTFYDDITNDLNLEIQGGTFNCNVRSAGKTTITGGTFNGTFDTTNTGGEKDGTIIITGGTFNATAYESAREYVVAGYEAVKNADNTWTVQEVVTETINSGTALKEAVENGGEINLGGKITLYEQLVINNGIILNLNGNTISGNGILNDNGVDMTINGPGIIEETVGNRGILKINGGTFSYVDNHVDTFNDSTTTINNGIFTTVYCTNGTINIRGGVFSGEVNPSKGAINISDGEFNGTVIWPYKGSITITGGVFNNGFAKKLVHEGLVTISGGTFKKAISKPENCTLEITGGTFAYEPDDSWIVDGYKAVDNDNGTWTVTAE